MSDKSIDEELTIKRVNKFLTDDLDRLLLLSGKTLHSLKQTDETINSYGNIVMTIYKTMISLSDLSREILTNLYIERMKPTEVAKTTGYGKSQYYLKRREALIEFADNYDYWQRDMDCLPVIDLHVYK